MKRLTDARGFTLIELLVAVTILGVLTLAIGATFAVLSRSTDGTRERFTQSRGPKLVGVYWTPDVNSSETVDPTGAICGATGTPLVTFLWGDDRYGSLLATWSENTSGSTTSLVRTRCTIADGVVSAPVQTTKVASAISATGTKVECGNPLAACGDDTTPVRVVLTLATSDGRSFAIDGIRKVR